MKYEIETITCNDTFYILRAILSHSKPALLMTCNKDEISFYINSIHRNNPDEVTIIERNSTCMLEHKKK